MWLMLVVTHRRANGLMQQRLDPQHLRNGRPSSWPGYNGVVLDVHFPARSTASYWAPLPVRYARVAADVVDGMAQLLAYE